MDLSFLLKHVRTIDERTELIELVEELLENNFRRDQSPIPNTAFSKNASDAINREINIRGITNNRSEMEKFLESILSEVKKLPEIRISIAIQPTETLINNLKVWAEKNGLNNAVFVIEVKSEIIAGAIVMSHKGEYGNYSLSSQLDKFFTDKKQEVISLLS
jgi:F0F1-type ATP synthase delta subunit